MGISIQNRYIPTKHVNVSVTCHVPLSINYSLTKSHAVCKSTFCLLRHDITPFLKDVPHIIAYPNICNSASDTETPWKRIQGRSGHFFKKGPFNTQD